MKKTPTYPRRSSDAYVNQKMLYKVRDELKANVLSVQYELHAVRDELKADISSVRFELSGVRNELKADIQDVKAEISRIGLLVEEQNNRNKIVLDGLAHIFERQDRVEKKLETI